MENTNLRVHGKENDVTHAETFRTSQTESFSGREYVNMVELLNDRQAPQGKTTFGEVDFRKPTKTENHRPRRGHALRTAAAAPRRLVPLRVRLCNTLGNQAPLVPSFLRQRDGHTPSRPHDGEGERQTARESQRQEKGKGRGASNPVSTMSSSTAETIGYLTQTFHPRRRSATRGLWYDASDPERPPLPGHPCHGTRAGSTSGPQR